jgi:4-hydroxybenzoate polyprenyltransferase
MAQAALPRGKFRAVLQLLRPANVVTACADVLAGYAAASLPPTFDRGARADLVWLLIATGCLYAGGVVLNDFFDRKLDAVERPERPIPNGAVRPSQAAWLGGVLLVGGVGAASLVNIWASTIAVFIAICALSYDAVMKRTGAGPVFMALCRAGNLMLGVAAVPAALPLRATLGALMAVYIGALTVISRGEVRGGRSGTAAGCFGAMLGVMIGLAALPFSVGPTEVAKQVSSILLTIVLAARVLPPFWQGFRQPTALTIRRAVRTGILSLVVFDAAVASLYAGPVYGIGVLALAVPAYALARLFAVT